MPTKKKDNTTFDPEQRALEISYTDYINNTIVLKEKPDKNSNPEVIKEFNTYCPPQISSNPNSNPNYSIPSSYDVSSESAPKHEAAPYPVSNFHVDSIQYSEPQRETVPPQQNFIPAPVKTQSELPLKKPYRFWQKRFDVILGATLGFGILARVFLNIASLNYLYWIIVLLVIGISFALIYFSKNPKSTRPFIFVAATFLIGFILGGLGK